MSTNLNRSEAFHDWRRRIAAAVEQPGWVASFIAADPTGGIVWGGWYCVPPRRHHNDNGWLR